eukprot:7402218-Alexandrium_andersonii.AAC.1
MSHPSSSGPGGSQCHDHTVSGHGGSLQPARCGSTERPQRRKPRPILSKGKAASAQLLVPGRRGMYRSL